MNFFLILAPILRDQLPVLFCTYLSITRCIIQFFSTIQRVLFSTRCFCGFWADCMYVVVGIRRLSTSVGKSPDLKTVVISRSMWEVYFIDVLCLVQNDYGIALVSGQDD